jgi:hypothetical protein
VTIVEQVGGTAATSPWHDHRVMLVSPTIAAIVMLAGMGQPIDAVLRGDAEEFASQWRRTPRVHADEDAIRWLTARQARAAS